MSDHAMKPYQRKQGQEQAVCQALCSLRVGLQGCTLLTEEGNLGVPSAYGGLSIPSNPNVSPVTSGEVMTQRHDTQST